MGDPPWTKDGRFTDLPSRIRNHEELDRYISQWTINYTHYEVTDILQRAGVAAAPLLDEEERLADPHLASRETYVKVDHPKAKGVTIYNVPWRLSRTPGHIQRSSPMLGEHNSYIYRELLGLSEEEIARLTEEKVIY
jgi:crotonobetainyl-CoA:carnitine CoA-transferase CaiB-like acyl-CoA transferase